MDVTATLYMGPRGYCFLYLEREDGGMDAVTISRSMFERLKHAGYPVHKETDNSQGRTQ